MKVTTLKAEIKRCERRAARLVQKNENLIKHNIPANEKHAKEHLARADKLRKQLADLQNPKAA